MKRNRYVRWFSAILLAIVISIGCIKFLAEPYIKKKIGKELNDKSGHSIEIRDIHIKWFLPGAALNGISINEKPDTESARVKGTIESVQIESISLFKLVFRGDFNAQRIKIYKSKLRVSIPRNEKDSKPVISKNGISIGGIVLDQINLELFSRSDSQRVEISEMQARLKQIEITENDSITIDLISLLELKMPIFKWQTADSMYLVRARGLSYSNITGLLKTDSLSINPSYSEYDFTGQFYYQKDRIEAVLSNIQMHDFSMDSLFQKGDFICNYIAIGNMDLDVFRDKRREFRHVQRKMLQEALYDYPGLLRIDSLQLLNGTMTYTEHAEDADEAGSVTLTRLRSMVKNIRNNPQYRNQDEWLTLKGEFLLMGEGQLKTELRVKLFEPHHAFFLSGTMGEMNLNELNRILENNSYVSVNGMAHSLNFDFNADDEKATGKLTFLYSGMKLKVKNDNSRFRNRIENWLINASVMDSNPLPGEKPREGIISYQRDPERFLFSYSVKTLMTGIKSTLTDNN